MIRCHLARKMSEHKMRIADVGVVKVLLNTDTLVFI